MIVLLWLVGIVIGLFAAIWLFGKIALMFMDVAEGIVHLFTRR